MPILEEIRKQPQHIREMMFGFSVVITVSLVGLVWFNSFQKDIYALLNPEDVREERALAQKNQDSLFSGIGESFADLKAMFSGLNDGSDPKDSVPVEKKNESKVYLLPLSEGK